MRYVYALAFVLFLLVVPGAGHADTGGVHPGVPAKDGPVTPEDLLAVRTSAALVDFCNKSIVNYRKALAILKTPPVVPVPPKIPPGCTQCGEQGSHEGSDAITAWANSAFEPERSATRNLLAMQRVYTLLGLSSGGQSGQELSFRASLTPLAQQCLKQIDPGTLNDTVNALVTRQIEGKAIPMVKAYHTDPDRMEAGAVFAMSAAHDYALWSGGDPGGLAASLAGDVAGWISATFHHIDENIFQLHQYYWCPNYLIMFEKLVEMGKIKKDDYGYLGVNYTLPDRTLLDEGDLREREQRILDFMHFKVKFDVRMIANQKDAHTNVHWLGDGEFYFDIDYRKGCYIPKLKGDAVHWVIDTFTMHSSTGDARLIGPSDFTAPLSGLKMNLCDSAPKLRLVFANYGPPTRMQVGDRETSAPLLMSAISAIAGQELKRTGQAPVQKQQIEQKMEKLKAQVAAHRTDPSWFMTTEGRAVLAEIQDTAAGTSSAAGSATLGNVLDTFEVPWSNGTAIPVTKEMTADSDTAHIVLQMTVVNDPQNK